MNTACQKSHVTLATCSHQPILMDLRCRSVTSVIFSSLTLRGIFLIPTKLTVALDASAIEVTRHATSSHGLHVEASELE